MQNNELLEKVKKQIKQIYPNANILLYGSRARGEANKDSDWDFLIVIDGDLSEREKLEMRYKLFEIEWEMEEIISSIIHTQKEWNQPIMQITPFYQNVIREGISI